MSANPVLPANSTFLTSVVINSKNKGSQVSPSTQKTKTPLAPTNVSATINGGNITVTMTVYIDAKTSITGLDIYQKDSYIEIVKGKPKTVKPIYVVYNYTEDIPSALYPYTFSFEMTKGSFNMIESYLYDEDPVTSRGTKTTVKNEML